MSRDTIKFELKDAFSGREVTLTMTLAGDSIDNYYEAFAAFLLAAGFAQVTIDRYLGDAE